jgi:hypothetical protein
MSPAILAAHDKIYGYVLLDESDQAIAPAGNHG